MAKNNYLGDKEFSRWALKLALPGAVQNLLSIGVNALNNILTGHHFGEIEMSAIAQAATVFGIYEVMSYGFAGSCAVMASQFWGKQDHGKIKKIISICLKFEAILGLVISAVMLLFPGFIMSKMSIDPDVIATGAEYLRLTAPTYFIYGLTTCLYSSFRSVEMVQNALWGNAICYLLNMGLSWLLVPSKGVIGAGLAALISRTVDLVYVLANLFTSKRLDYKMPDLLSRSPELINDYLKVTWPILGHELIWSVGNSMNQILMGRMSTAATSAYAIAITLTNIITFMTSGLGQAATTIVGKKIGEGDKKDAQKAALTFIWYTLFMGITCSLVLFLIKDRVVASYNVSDEVKDMARIMCNVLEVQAFCTGFDSIVLVNTLRAGGMGKVGFWTDIVVMWMIGIPLGWLALLVWKLPPQWVVFLVKLDMPLKSAVGVYMVLKGNWIRNLTVHQEKTEA